MPKIIQILSHAEDRTNDPTHPVERMLLALTDEGTVLRWEEGGYDEEAKRLYTGWWGTYARSLAAQDADE